MSEINQAIKIELLKQEWYTKRAELQLIIVRDLKPRLQTVDSQLKSIEQEKRELNAKIFSIEDKLKETDEHYRLLIRASQSFSQELNSKTENPLNSCPECGLFKYACKCQKG